MTNLLIQEYNISRRDPMGTQEKATEARKASASILEEFLHLPSYYASSFDMETTSCKVRLVTKVDDKSGREHVQDLSTTTTKIIQEQGQKHGNCFSEIMPSRMEIVPKDLYEANLLQRLRK